MSVQTGYSPCPSEDYFAGPNLQQSAMKTDLITSRTCLSHMEDHPMLTRPSPTAFDNMGYLASLLEPALCITPEKKQHRNFKSNSSGDQVLGVGHKVRFDNIVDIHHLSPQSPSKDVNVEIIDIGVSDSLSQDISEGSDGTEDSYSKDAQTNGDCYAYCTQKFPSASKVQPLMERNCSSTQRHVYISQNKCAGWRPENGQIGSVGVGNQTEVSDNTLSQPEFNSTLRLGLALQEVCDSKLKPQAAEDLVHNFESARKIIEQKATQKVNWQTVAYRDLISVDVNASNLNGRLERDHKPAAKVKHKQEGDAAMSNILDLLKKDYERETLSYGGAVVIPETGSQPRTACSRNAFDIYVHVRSWDQ